ncbi:cx9C motif-containing protein 4 [Eleutherodactylus coqui]|uniref:cx9C motif-containing protein 4 n=1 Tax=Eleutherodactylus coqui TaxID=57060 RepID=UPI0034623566
MPQSKDPCQKAACAIQKCLQLNSYKESSCEREIAAMRMCCSKLVAGRSVCCSGFRDQRDAEESVEGSSSNTAFSAS